MIFNEFFSTFYFQVRATLLNDDEDALQDLRLKEEKRLAKEERKKKAEEKKKKGTEKKKRPAKRRIVDVGLSAEEESDAEEPVQMVLDDSSEYSDELTTEEQSYLSTSHYPFAEKAPEVRDFLFLVRLFFHIVFFVLIDLSNNF